MGIFSFVMGMVFGAMIVALLIATLLVWIVPGEVSQVTSIRTNSSGDTTVKYSNAIPGSKHDILSGARFLRCMITNQTVVEIK